MAVVYINPTNNLLEWRFDQEDESRFPIPQGTPASSIVRFDSVTNAALFADIRLLSGTGRYTITAGVLRKDGVQVDIDQPSQTYQDRTIIDQLDDDIDSLQNPLTLIQLQPIVRRGLRMLRYVLKRLKEKS